MDRLIKTVNVPARGSIRSVSVADDSDRFLIGLSVDGPELWSLSGGAVLRRLTGMQDSGGATSAALDPKGRFAAACGMGNEAIVWNVQTGAVVKSVAPRVSDNAGLVAFSPDGQVVLSGYFGSLTLFDTALSPKLKFRIHEDGADFLMGLAVAPGGALAAIGYARSDSKRDIIVYDLVSETPTVQAVAHPPIGVGCIAWSGDNILYGSKDDVGLISATHGTKIRSFVGQTGYVTCVAFGAGGRLAASGSNDIRIWDVATGRQLASLASGAVALAFTPDGKSLISATDRSFSQWNVSDLAS